MSTIVPMPVRVKPPPAEIGEIISPGCAFFETATPANGARMTVFVQVLALERRRAARRHSTCWPRRSPSLARERVALGARGVEVGLRCGAAGAASSLGARRVALGLLEPHRGLAQRGAPPQLRLGERERAAGLESSRRASTWPSFDVHAFLDGTSCTLPVTFEETVA